MSFKPFNQENPPYFNPEELQNWCSMFLERVDLDSNVLTSLLYKAHNEGVKYGEQNPPDDLEGMGLLRGKCGAWTS